MCADVLPTKDDFWATLLVKQVVVTVGEFDVFRDDVIAMAERCGAGIGDRLTFEVLPGEVHVQAVVDRVLGLPPTPSFVVHLEWLQASRVGSRDRYTRSVVPVMLLKNFSMSRLPTYQAKSLPRGGERSVSPRV